MVADSDLSRERNIPTPYVRKSSTAKQQTNEKQPYATGWHCVLPEFRHTGPLGGAFILGHQKGKACYRATSAGLEHGTFEPEHLTFTPAPTAPAHTTYLSLVHNIPIKINRDISEAADIPILEFLTRDIQLCDRNKILGYYSSTCLVRIIPQKGNDSGLK